MSGKMGEIKGTILSELEQNGLKKMRLLTKEYLAKNQGSEEVRDFLAKAGSDNDLLLTYLKGRKYRPEHAWETLKRKAEVRYHQYPELFTHEIPRCLIQFQKNGWFGLLKHRDKFGRRILCCNGSKWDTQEYSILDVTQASAYVCEKLLKDEDALNNGVIFIQNCEGMGMNHAKQYSLHAMLRILNAFWYACPLKFKGIYYLNVPYYLTFIYRMIKPFFSKKLKERIVVSTPNNKRFEGIYAIMGPEILPKFLGGDIDDIDALEELS